MTVGAPRWSQWVARHTEYMVPNTSRWHHSPTDHSPSAFPRLQGGPAGFGTLLGGRVRRFGHGFAQAFPHVALFFAEAFDGFRPDTLAGVLLKPSHDLLSLSGVSVQGLCNLLRFLGGQTPDRKSVV